MQEREREQLPERKHIVTLKSKDVEGYLKVPGWRIWACQGPLVFPPPPIEYEEAEKEAAAKPQALLVSAYLDGNSYYTLAEIYRKMTGKFFGVRAAGTAGAHRPYFLLEPLSEEEMSSIDESGEAASPLGFVDKPHELLRAEDFRTIIER